MVHFLPTHKTCSAVDTAELRFWTYSNITYSIGAESLIGIQNLPQNGSCNSAAYFKLIITSLPPFTHKLMLLPNAPIRLWKPLSDEPTLKFETGLMSYRMYIIAPYVYISNKWRFSSCITHFSVLLKKWFNTATEDDIYAHFYLAQYGLEHVYDFFQRIN